MNTQTIDYDAEAVCTFAQFHAATHFLQADETEASQYLQLWRPDKWREQLRQRATQPNTWRDTVYLYVNDERVSAELSTLHLESLAVDAVESERVGAEWVTHLEQVKDILSLTITQTAELFGVTRKAVYDWYEGSVPRQSTVDRTDALLEVLGSLSQSIDLTRLKSVWNVPISGSSFRQVFDLSASDPLAYRAGIASKLSQLSARLVAAKALPKGAETVRPSNAVADFDRYAIANE